MVKNEKNMRWLLMGLFFILFASVQARPRKVEVKTFLDTMVFNYERTIWGKNPANPLKPLGENHQSNLKDLSYYGVFDDAPMLSTDKSIFIDSAPPVPRVTAQRPALVVKDEHHCHIGIGGGIAPTFMTYNSDFGESKVAFSPSAHFLFDYYLSRKWGFLVGLELSFTTGKFVAKDYVDTYSFTDYEGTRLNFTYKVGEIIEENKLVNLSIPIMLGYSHSHWSGHAGFKIGVPVTLKYKQTLSDCDFSCEMPDYNTIITHAPAYGIGDKTVTYEGEFSSRPVMFMFALDFGYRFHINRMFDLGVAFFVDKGLFKMGIKAKHDKNNEQYKEEIEAYDFLKTSEIKSKDDLPAHLIQSSVLSGKQMSSGERLSDGLGYTSLGLRVTIYVNRFGKHYFSDTETAEMNEPFYGVSSEVRQSAFSTQKKQLFPNLFKKTKSTTTTTTTTTKTTTTTTKVVPVEKVVVDTVERIVKDTVDKVVVDTVERIDKDTVDKVVVDTVERIVKDTVDNVVVDTVERIVKDTVDKVVVDTVEQIVKDTVDKAVVDTVERVVKDTVDKVETVEKVVKDTVDKAVVDTVENVVVDTVVEEVVDTVTKVSNDTIEKEVVETVSSDTEVAPTEPVDEVAPTEPVDDVAPTEPVNEVAPTEPVDDAVPLESVNKEADSVESDINNGAVESETVDPVNLEETEPALQIETETDDSQSFPTEEDEPIKINDEPVDIGSELKMETDININSFDEE